MQLIVSEFPRASTNAASIDLAGVRRDICFFIKQYRQGRRETTDLVAVESRDTRKHVSLEAEQTNAAVKLVGQKVDRLTALEGAQMDEKARNYFFESLKYPGFNQRRKQIDTAYADTLKWIFVGDDHDFQTSERLSEKGAHTKTPEHPDENFLDGIKWDSLSNWLRSTDAIYWISGKPGSGKSTVIKHILADGRTQKYLDIWFPGCTIVSHYFWLPGSPMQRNMEGLLCSLLYQLLENNSIALREVISTVSDLKSSYTDWSLAELHSSVVKALGLYQNGVCLFLDGIDEIKPEDGTKHGIPEFLEWAIELSQSNKIKLCLASRPDPHILETRLCRYPRMRLQDLNYEDLKTYADGRVKIPEKRISDQDAIIRLLVDKAEGVFLWLILAIKSVNEGFRNDDSDEILQERIDKLPQGLDSLYKDMWARAGADNPAEYRQTAALYFKLILASDRRCGDIKAFDVMLATTDLADSVLHALADPSKLVSEDDMLQQYGVVEKKLNIYCVGLIQQVPVQQFDHYIPLFDHYMDSASDCSWYGHVYDRIFHVVTRSKLQFVHRTARDFFTDTKSGREILEFDASSDSSIESRLLYARLASLALFTRGDAGVLDWARRLNEYLVKCVHTGNELPQSWNRLVSACEQLADSGRLLAGCRGFTYRCSGTRFLNAIAATQTTDSGIGPLISRIRNRSLSESEKSSFLLASISIGFANLRPLFSISREMLRAGADLNAQGWTARDTCEYLVDTESAPHEVVQTPWQLLLVLSVDILLSGTQIVSFAREMPLTVLTSLAEVLLLFISEGARLNDPVNLVFRLARYKHDTWDRWRLMYLQTDEKIQGEIILTSIPANMIVKLLVNCLHRFCSTSDTESSSKICADLEHACESLGSVGTCRVFGKFKHRLRTPAIAFSWWETTNDVKMQLGRKVMEGLERESLLSWPVEGADCSEERRIDSEQLFQCIWKHESWTLRTTVFGTRSVYEQLVELGIMVSLDGIVEVHSMKEWVRKHNLENPQYGGAT